MRTLIGPNRFTKISADDSGAGNRYYISRASDDPNIPIGEFGHVQFQVDPVGNGVNGCFMEDLIAIVIDRLEHFQAGVFTCRANAMTITKLEEALHWLDHRTKDRRSRGVLGTDKL